jgi:putative hydrolase of the HAD superfamily
VAEWFKAAVLKTAVSQGTVGSNPTPSATSSSTKPRKAIQKGAMPIRKALLLDLDDTIIDDSSNVERCWRDACLVHGSELEPLDPCRLFDAIERTRSWYWSDPDRHREGRLDLHNARREVVRRSLADLGIDNEALAERIAATYGSRRELGVQPIPGAIETVQWLRETGCRTALLTNGAAESQRGKVDRFQLAGLFDAILIEGELGYGKPDTRVYRGALERLRVKPEEATMVGDNLEFDVLAPQELGVYGVWIDVGGKGVPPEHTARPDRTIRALSELRMAVLGETSP